MTQYAAWVLRLDNICAIPRSGRPEHVYENRAALAIHLDRDALAALDAEFPPPLGPYGGEWGWTWPLNRRVLYNRASADPQGRPWSERKALIWWDAEDGEWTGHDVADFEKTKPPDYRPPEGAEGPQALHGDDPFIMMSDGKGWLFAPAGLADGPLPTQSR